MNAAVFPKVRENIRRLAQAAETAQELTSQLSPMGVSQQQFVNRFTSLLLENGPMILTYAGVMADMIEALAETPTKDSDTRFWEAFARGLEVIAEAERNTKSISFPDAGDTGEGLQLHELTVDRR